MTEPAIEPFGLSAVYWSPDYGAYTWHSSGTADLAPTLEVYAQNGFDRFDCVFPWSSLQPDGRRVPVAPLRDLEIVLDAAADRGLKVVPSVPSFDIGGDLWAPTWALLPPDTGRRRVVRGHHVDRSGVRDLLTDPALVEAIRSLVRDVVGAFHGHPAVDAWRVADGATAVTNMRDPDEVLEWLRGLSDAARSLGATEPLRFCTSVHDVIANPAIDLRAMADLRFRLDLVLDWSPEWRNGASSEWYAFLAAYAGSLHGLPVGFTGVGLELGINAEDVLRGALEGGASGCSAWSMTTMSPALKRAPPFDLRPDLLTTGIMDVAGNITSFGGPWGEMATALPARHPVPANFPTLDSELRHRDPEAYARECWETWTR